MLSKAIILLVVLSIAQIILLLVNIKIDFTIINNISWWYVFIPVYITIVIVALGFGILSVVNIQ